MFGWPCDKEMEELRDKFARATDPAEAEEASPKRCRCASTQYPTHIHLGQWYQPGAARKNVSGVVAARRRCSGISKRSEVVGSRLAQRSRDVRESRRFGLRA